MESLNRSEFAHNLPVILHSKLLVNADISRIHNICRPVDALIVAFRSSLQIKVNTVADEMH